MQRISNGPVRGDWRSVVIGQGLVYVDTELPDAGQPGMNKIVSYWREGTYYVLDECETMLIGRAAAAVFKGMVRGTDKFLEFERDWHHDPSHMPRDCYFHRMGIPEMTIGPIIRSWQLDEPDGSPNRAHEWWPSVYARFDFCPILGPDGKLNHVRVFEFNADTPTSVVETVEIQWKWLEANHQYLETRYVGKIDQWNGLYDALVNQWIAELTTYQQKTGKKLTCAHVAWSDFDDSGEDEMTCVVMGNALEEAARQMGRGGEPAFRVKYTTVQAIRHMSPDQGPSSLIISGVGNGAGDGYLVDGDGDEIQLIFKLYPWEHITDPEHTSGGFSEFIMQNLMGPSPIVWVEPPWKALWSNKAIWAILWEMCQLHPDDPDIAGMAEYLLPTYFEDDPRVTSEFRQNCARKPFLGREGANVTLYGGGDVLEHTSGQYDGHGYVLQELAVLPELIDPREGPMHPVFGVWMVGDADVGLIIRESGGLVTGNTSYVAPHAVRMGV